MALLQKVWAIFTIFWGGFSPNGKHVILDIRKNDIYFINDLNYMDKNKKLIYFLLEQK